MTQVVRALSWGADHGIHELASDHRSAKRAGHNGICHLCTGPVPWPKGTFGARASDRERLWGAFFAYLFLGEALGPQAWNQVIKRAQKT